MKAKRMDSNYTFYLKVLFTILLIASLAFLQAPYVKANQGQGVPNQTSLEVCKTIEVKASRGIELIIHKTADPLEITLHQGATASVTYRIDVAGSVADQIAYTVTGKIKAENVGGNPAIVTGVWDEVEYRVKGGGWTPAGSTTISDPASPIPVGESFYYDYSVVFTVSADTVPTAIRNNAYVKISNRGGENKDEPYHGKASLGGDEDGDEGELPTPTVSQLPETVNVYDDEDWVESSGSGVSFSVDSVTWSDGSSDDPDGPWNVTLPNTIIVTKTITVAADATPGTHKLRNTARIEGGAPASKDVDITVPQPQGGGNGQPPGDGGGQQSTGGGGGEQPSGGGGGEQAATVATEAAPAPEQVAVLPTVVSPPTPAPEVVAQAKPAATPKKLPLTGVNSWYVWTAVLLIMAGSLLQLFRSPQPRYSRKR